MAKKPKWKQGDVFAFEIGKDERLLGHVKLDVDEQCIRPRRVLTSSNLTFFQTGFLVDVRRQIDGDIVLPAAFVFDGDWEVVENRRVDVETVDFPWTLSMVGPKPHVKWGELTFPVDLSVPDFRSIVAPPTLAPASSLVSLSLMRMDRTADIQKLGLVADETFGPGRVDLRLSVHHEKIRTLLGTRISDRYFSSACRYGYDLRRFYIDPSGELDVVACPYCNAILIGELDTCQTCGRDLGDDARLQTTATELAAEKRKRCSSCSTSIVATASVCPGCKHKQ